MSVKDPIVEAFKAGVSWCLRNAGNKPDFFEAESSAAGQWAANSNTPGPTEMAVLREHAARLEMVKGWIDATVGRDRSQYATDLICIVDGTTEIPQAIRQEFGL